MRILILILLALVWLSIANQTLGDTLGYYEVKVERVIDGDTFEATVEVWPGMTANTLVRIAGVDTPEIRGKCEDERTLAQIAKTTVANWLKESVVIYDVQPDKYGGRVVARVTAKGQDIGALLIDSRLAHPYDGGKKSSWCAE